MDKADIKALAAQEGIDISSRTLGGLQDWYTGLCKIYDAADQGTSATLDHDECLALAWAIQGLLKEVRR